MTPSDTPSPERAEAGKRIADLLDENAECYSENAMDMVFLGNSEELAGLIVEVQALAASPASPPAEALPAEVDVKALRKEVMRLIREDFDPTPPGWEGREWDNNAEDVADKMLAVISGAIAPAMKAVRAAKMLVDNVNEFGQVTDPEFLDCAETAVKAALSASAPAQEEGVKPFLPPDPIWGQRGLGAKSFYTSHPDDIAVDRFSTAMKDKLAQKRDQGRGGWEDKDDCSNAFLTRLLRDHVEKGDPVDVGNLAMMIHQRGERIAPPSLSDSKAKLSDAEGQS